MWTSFQNRYRILNCKCSLRNPLCCELTHVKVFWICSSLAQFPCGPLSIVCYSGTSILRVLARDASFLQPFFCNCQWTTIPLHSYIVNLHIMWLCLIEFFQWVSFSLTLHLWPPLFVPISLISPTSCIYYTNTLLVVIDTWNWCLVSSTVFLMATSCYFLDFAISLHFKDFSIDVFDTRICIYLTSFICVMWIPWFQILQNLE
jgi:hypothetical protein